MNDDAIYLFYVGNLDMQEFYFSHPLKMICNGKKINVPYKIKSYNSYYNFENSNYEFLLTCSAFDCKMNCSSPGNNKKLTQDWQKFVYNALPDGLKDCYLEDCYSLQHPKKNAENFEILI